MKRDCYLGVSLESQTTNELLVDFINIWLKVLSLLGRLLADMENAILAHERAMALPRRRDKP